ncbi:MAG: hypothetical protein L6367_09425 [Cellulomonas sp.]|nr:hypothetical protein [Cellulomonas sp.]
MTEPFARRHRKRSVPVAGRSRSTVLTWIGPVAVLLVAFSTAAAVWLGPAPHRSTDTTWLRDLDKTLIKPADRIALASWFALTIGLALVSWVGARRRGQGHHRVRWLATVVSAAVTLVLAAVLWSEDPFELWSGLSTGDLALGIMAASALIAGIASRDQRWRAAGLLVAALVLALAVPAWIQTPATVVDPRHFGYTSDELSAVAAGRFPLFDYFPQYTVVLPYLFAVPLALWPAHAPAVVLSGMLILQLVTLVAAVVLPNLVAGRRFLAASVAIVVPAVFVPVANGTTASSYFQGMPLRDVLPVLTLLLTMVLLRSRPTARWAVPWPWLALGAASGVTALNNPDFGLAAAAAVVVTVIIVQRSLGDLVRALVPLGAGLLVPFLLYSAAGAANGTPVDWPAWLVFERVFGPAGLANVPMGAFGLHVAIVGLFVAASAIGFVLVLSSPRDKSSFAYRQGLLLALVGGWSLLALPYLAGRSVPSTYIGGFAFNAGLVVASMLPLFARAWRSAQVRSGDFGSPLVVALPLTAVGSILAGVLMLPSPASRLPGPGSDEPAGRYALLAEQQLRLANSVPLDGGPDMDSALAGGQVVQALPYASLMALTSSIPSVAVASSPEYAEATWWFSRRQCAQPLPVGTEYLLLRTTTARILADDPSCADYADFSGMHQYGAAGQDGDDLTFALIPVRTG